MKKDKKKWKLLTKWSTKVPLYLDKNHDKKRYKKCMKQLKKTGICYSETWSLYSVISEFALPRLKMFKKYNNGVPYAMFEIQTDSYGKVIGDNRVLTKKERKKNWDDATKKWDNTLDDMIFAHELIVKDDWYKWDDKDKDKIEKGLNSFHKYYRDLWW